MQPTESDTVAAAKAIVAATALAALLLSAGMGGLPLFPFAFPIALLITMPAGLILYAAARVMRIAGWVSAGLGGILTSAVLWLPDLHRAPSFDEEWRDGVASITGRQYTMLGWVEHLLPVAGQAAIGLVSGLFFWFFLIRHTLSPAVRRGAYLWPVLMAVAAILYPFATQDRSCHGAYSATPVAQLGIALPADQWPALARELDDFAKGGTWSVRKNLSSAPRYPWLDFSLCEPRGNRIAVLGAPGVDFPVAISLSQLQEGRAWKPVFRALHDRLKARWPDAIRYQNANGLPISDLPD